jgi:regulator of protease activity HflC (stomatin/prohibitin superfamily)
MYLFIPFIDKLVMDYKQERVLNLGYISTSSSDPNSDSRVVAVSCNIRYELMDFYRAYTSIHDYEASLKDHTLSILAKHCRGKSYDDWKSPGVVKQVEQEVLKELREVVTERWGLKIHNIYITDNIACNMQRLVHEGSAVSVKNEIRQEESSLI